jgi:hypothetical protein
MYLKSRNNFFQEAVCDVLHTECVRPYNGLYSCVERQREAVFSAYIILFYCGEGPHTVTYTELSESSGC